MPAIPPRPVPISVLVTVDPVLRESALAGLVLGSARTVAVRYDLLLDQGTLRRIVTDATGVLEDERVDLEHLCLTCGVREDALPTLARLARDSRWSDIVLALPTTAEPLAVTRALGAATRGRQLAHCRVATTFAVVDLTTLESDLLGSTPCRARGLALAEDDERAVGEALAGQLEQVDLVVTDGTDATGSGLVDRLRGADSHRIGALHTLHSAQLAHGRHDPTAAERRANPVSARGSLSPRSDGGDRDPDDRSWTLVLDSALPFHPERLLANMRRLGAGLVRARGVFHVANRPDSTCLWDSAARRRLLGRPDHRVRHRRRRAALARAPRRPRPMARRPGDDLNHLSGVDHILRRHPANWTLLLNKTTLGSCPAPPPPRSSPDGRPASRVRRARRR